VNRAILSHALTGGRTFLGNLEQAPGCINVLDVGHDWIVRAVNVTPYDPVQLRGRLTTMEELWSQFRST
jgi:probable phosphoglycerate mutase